MKFSVVILSILLLTTACNMNQENTSGAPTPMNTSAATINATIAAGGSGVLPTLSGGNTGGVNVFPTVPAIPTVGIASAGSSGVAGTGGVDTSNTLGGSAAGSNVAVTCTQPTGWVTYTVVAGDTLGNLALAINGDLAQITAANCLTDADVIQTGQVIYLPVTPPINTAANTTGVAVTAVANTGVNMAGVANNAVSPNTTTTILGNFWVEPATVSNNGRYQVVYGSTVTLRVKGLNLNSATPMTVTFAAAPIGSTVNPVQIGTDNNIADGIALPWQVNTQNLHVNIWAVVTDGAGTTIQSAPIEVIVVNATGQ